MIFDYDPTSDAEYGHYSCGRCEAVFFGGGQPLHKIACPVRAEGYDP